MHEIKQAAQSASQRRLRRVRRTGNGILEHLLHAGAVGESYAAILGRAGRTHLQARTGSDSRLRQGVDLARYMVDFVRENPAKSVAAC